LHTVPDSSERAESSELDSSECAESSELESAG